MWLGEGHTAIMSRRFRPSLVKRALLLFALLVGLSASPMCAGEKPGLKEPSVHVGTLTLEAEGIVFRPEHGQATLYKFSPVPSALPFLSIPGVDLSRREPDGELNPATLVRLVLRVADTGDTLELRRQIP